MIIFDDVKRKIDAHVDPNGWVQITSFKSEDGTDWKFSVIRMDPLAAKNLVNLIRSSETLSRIDQSSCQVYSGHLGEGIGQQ